MYMADFDIQMLAVGTGKSNFYRKYDFAPHQYYANRYLMKLLMEKNILQSFHLCHWQGEDI